MMHVTYGGKSVLMDDEAATTLLEYAAVLGRASRVDIVSVSAMSSDGNNLTVAYLLNESSELMVESTTSALAMATDVEAVSYMRGRMEGIRHPPAIQPEDDFEPATVTEL